MAAVERDEFLAGIQMVREDIREGIRGLNDRLDELNGRTRKNEVAIAVQSAQTKQISAWVGGAASVIVAALIALLQAWASAGR